MPLFELPKKPAAGSVADLKNKINNTAAPVIVTGSGGKGGGKQNLIERINSIVLLVNQKLSKYQGLYECIREEEALENYITACIENGIVSIDTETSSLDEIMCNIAGFSMYTPGQKAVYVPLNHLSYVTFMPIDKQIPVSFAKEQLKRLDDAKVKTVMFNATFDVRVIENQVGVYLNCYWDCYIAARMLNENEDENGLKPLHHKYCEGDIGEEAFNFNDLFEDFNFQYVPINTGYIYAARDAKITYELYEFQLPFLTKGTPECEENSLSRVADITREVEMMVLPQFIALEDTGISFDMGVQTRLSEKYHKRLEEREIAFWNVCDNYKQEISSYRRISGYACKLDEHINIGSPTQIAILLYDILHLKCPDKKKPRGTGEEIISQIDHPICKAILDYREVVKLLGTYIDKMPEIICPKTGRIHASYNQLGADTGRTSSKDPNMQNIPSRGEGKEIRQMFVATKGYCLISSDYSAQEPRLTAHLSGDKRMIQAYIEGKDLYCEIASIAFDVPYEECTEHRPDGSSNPEGKKRRGMAKVIVLGKPNGFAPWPQINAPPHRVRLKRMCG